MRRTLAALMWLACGSAFAHAQGGLVFDDGNGNGVHDAGEAGVAGVAVSNGHDLARAPPPPAGDQKERG
ncbi:MAG: hypothetical protein L0H23_12880, partial [Luteimonas sp.]|nr:hypothetical protein [Luteimonas sp.]